MIYILYVEGIVLSGRKTYILQINLQIYTSVYNTYNIDMYIHTCGVCILHMIGVCILIKRKLYSGRYALFGWMNVKARSILDCELINELKRERERENLCGK